MKCSFASSGEPGRWPVSVHAIFVQLNSCISGEVATGTARKSDVSELKVDDYDAVRESAHIESRAFSARAHIDVSEARKAGDMPAREEEVSSTGLEARNI